LDYLYRLGIYKPAELMPCKSGKFKLIKSTIVFKGSNMRYTFLLLAMLFGGLPAATAQEAKNEEQCKIFVGQTVKSLVDQSKKYGENVKLYDLSDEDILDIQNKKGSCDAMKEINIRLNQK
jgi:hypothetical protein